MHARHAKAGGRGGQRQCLEPLHAKGVPLSAQPDGVVVVVVVVVVAVDYGSRSRSTMGHGSRSTMVHGLGGSNRAERPRNRCRRRQEQVDCFIYSDSRRSTNKETRLGRYQEADQTSEGQRHDFHPPPAGPPPSTSVQPRRRKPANRAAPMRFDKRALRASPSCAAGVDQPATKAIVPPTSKSPRDAVPRHPDSNQPCTQSSRWQPAMHPASARHPRRSRECRRLPPRLQRRNVAKLTNLPMLIQRDETLANQPQQPSNRLHPLVALGTPAAAAQQEARAISLPQTGLAGTTHAEGTNGASKRSPGVIASCSAWSRDFPLERTGPRFGLVLDDRLGE
ncbi:hypothetical protein PMIN01_07522 [Paraphaeosphaeria minitans]|uniref:Uncharacterized protein n=1 Tax=Paraphaeosphaeria minitans TaxID=565426 RepID=A0A9P6KQJ3_9PLEO|nr:hypothetical protein PMIN01_07522 [Paraphaeosphaeria minitans]